MVQSNRDTRLLRSLADELKLPLVQIARTAELAQTSPHKTDISKISYIADSALRLVDGYLLSLDHHGESTLQLEPVSISDLLTDTAHTLQPIAREHNCDIRVSLSGKYGPAMAHRESLGSALLLIGHALIETRAVETRRHELTLGSHRTGHGLVAGVYDNQPGLSTDVLRRGRALHGSSSQSLPKVTGSSAAGIFVADSLIKSMAAVLRVGRHNKLTGLAVTLHPSTQLKLI